MELEVSCKKCGAQFVPTHRDYVAGTWRLCPPCRKATPKKGAAA